MNDRHEHTSGGTPVWIQGNSGVARAGTLICVHGVLMDHRMWAAQVAALGCSWRMLSYDMLGHGGAPNLDGPRQLSDFTAQLHEVVTTFARDEKPVLAGFSMGGLVAQAYAIGHHASLRGLVLLNTVYRRSAAESQVVRARYRSMAAAGVGAALVSARTRWFTAADRAEHAHHMADILRWIEEGEFAPKLKAHRVFATSDVQCAGKLGVISCPALVMTGQDDAGSTPRMAATMAACIDGARLEVLSGQRHMMTVLDAARVNRILTDFLSNLP